MAPPDMSAGAGGSAFGELRRSWLILLACCVGAAVGAGAFPLFLVPVIGLRLEDAFGWTRVDTSSLVSMGFAGAAIGAPLVGWLNDRWSIKAPAVSSIAAIGAVLSLGAIAPGDILVWQIGTFLLTLLGAGTLSVAFSKIICQHFHAMRGLALGLTIGSVSFLSAVALPLLSGIIDAAGLQAFFLYVGIFYFVVALPFLLWALPSSRSDHRQSDSPTIKADAPVSGSAIWLLGAAGILVAAATGAAGHLVAVAADGEVVEPAVVGSVFAAGVMVARPITGFVIDHVNAAPVGAGAFGLAAIGLILAAVFGDQYVLLAAVLLSLAVGADIDIVAFLTSKYVGPSRFGRVFGWIYCGVLAAAALGPLLIAFQFDAFGSYEAPFFATAAILSLASVLMMALPPYAGRGHSRA